MSAAPGAAAIGVRTLAVTDYAATWRAMRDFTAARDAHTPDEVWVTEHPPVYTLGLAGRREHLRRDNGIAVVHSDRGGQVTYHGPGQLVVYVLLDLRRSGIGVRELVRTLEGAVIDWLASLRIRGWGRDDRPGVYVEHAGAEAKIAALGLRIRNGCSYHGLALNVAMDLAPFADIDPCGYRELAVTQLAELGVARSVEQAGRELAPIVVQRLGARLRAPAPVAS
jgi:lipoyl(octanoyl) transferase